MGKATKFTVQKLPRFSTMPPAATKINLKDKYVDGEIDLSMCDLQDVPVKEISQFKKAYSLDLSNNHLSILPKNFTTLTNITKLDLSKNEITELPENFGDLNKLKHLDLYKNLLKHLPLSFSKLIALKWLDLKDNPLLPAIASAAGPCLDSKQCQQCAKDIVIFYSTLEAQVIEERENREKQRQKNLQANEMARQKQNQDKKNKIKKEKVKQKQESVQESHSGTNVEITTKKSAEKIPKKDNKKVENSTSIFLSITKFLLTSFFTLIFTLFILTSINFTHTKFVEDKIVEVWNNNAENLPSSIKNFTLMTGEYIKNVHSGTGVFIINLHTYLHELLNSNAVFIKLVDMFNSAVYKMSDYYQQIFGNVKTS